MIDQDTQTTAWDTIWDHLTEDERKSYISLRDKDQHYPLEIAAQQGNVNALKRLTEIYQQLLPDHSDMLISFHNQLCAGLSVLGSNINANSQHIECCMFLLHCCEQTAVIDSTFIKGGRLANKYLTVMRSRCVNAQDSVLIVDNKYLLSMFVGECRMAFVSKNLWFLGAIIDFVSTQGTNAEFKKFKEELVAVLNSNSAYRRDKYETCWQVLNDKLNLANDQTDSNKLKVQEIVTTQDSPILEKDAVSKQRPQHIIECDHKDKAEALIKKSQIENEQLKIVQYKKQKRESATRITLVVIAAIFLTPFSLFITLPRLFRAEEEAKKNNPIQKLVTSKDECARIKDMRKVLRALLGDIKIKDYDKPSKMLLSKKGTEEVYLVDKAQLARFNLFAKHDQDYLNKNKEDVQKQVEESKAESKKIMRGLGSR